MDNSQKKVIIIGSGPAGFASAKTLVKKGIPVVMIDYGNKKNQNHIDLYLTNDNRKELLEIKDFKWSDRESDDDLVKGKGDFKKQYFYNNSNLVIDSTVNSIANMSLAYGGLSNLWGGAALPVSDKDIPDWPIRNRDLSDYYKEIAKDMVISGDEDNLGGEFQPNINSAYNFPLGSQIKDFYDDLLLKEGELTTAGVYFGRSKLAINPRHPLKNESYPYGPIFNTALELQELEKTELFEYYGDIFISKFVEDNDKVRVSGYHKETKDEFGLDGERVIIACGAISTALLMKNSIELAGENLVAKTNQNAFFPYLRFKRAKGVSKEIENSIAQLFIEINNEITFNRFTHIQVYQYGDYVLEPIKRILKSFTPIFSFLMNFILERVIIMQSMLHSDFSDELDFNFVKGENGAHKIKIEGRKNSKARQGYRQLVKAINRYISGGRAFRLGMFIDPPGASNHVGGTFPMSEKPNREKNESDIWGRVNDLERVHIVDASVLPSLPSPTITYTIMANAARIADFVGKNFDHE